MDFMLREMLYQIERDYQEEIYNKYRKLGLTDIEIFKHFINKIFFVHRTPFIKN